MFSKIKKADVILLIVLVLLGAGLSLLSASAGSAGQQVEVSVDGQPYGTYRLSEDQTIEISHDGHTNKITIKDDTVQMTYSDCRNQICVNDGSISQTNQSIVCLPNRVVIEITGKEEKYDAISN